MAFGSAGVSEEVPFEDFQCAVQGADFSSKLWIGESCLLLRPGEMIVLLKLETGEWPQLEGNCAVAALQQAGLCSGMLSPVRFHFRL